MSVRMVNADKLTLADLLHIRRCKRVSPSGWARRSSALSEFCLVPFTPRVLDDLVHGREDCRPGLGVTEKAGECGENPFPKGDEGVDEGLDRPGIHEDGAGARVSRECAKQAKQAVWSGMSDRLHHRRMPLSAEESFADKVIVHQSCDDGQRTGNDISQWILVEAGCHRGSSLAAGQAVQICVIRRPEPSGELVGGEWAQFVLEHEQCHGPDSTLRLDRCTLRRKEVEEASEGGPAASLVLECRGVQRDLSG
eukprot:scaffold164221_cov27-Tisochrysis_lutea.AAC.1